MTPRVTIGIPVFNAAGTIRATINSVLAQTLLDWELLLIDDGSNDGTPEILASVNDPRIRVIVDGVNRGLVFRLNQMICLAQAPLFARMDADDLMHPERLQRQVEAFEADASLVLCGSAAYVTDERGVVYGIRGDDRDGRFAGVRSGFIHPTVMGNTAWFRNNPYDPAYIRAEDAELWARVDPATPCKLIKDPLLFYREPLAPHLDKYRSSCRSMRNIFRHYGRQRLGVAKTCVAVLDSFAKEMLYTACALGGFAAWLIRRRNRSCNEQELRIANHVLSELAGRTLSPAQLHFK